MKLLRQEKFPVSEFSSAIKIFAPTEAQHKKGRRERAYPLH